MLGLEGPLRVSHPLWLVCGGGNSYITAARGSFLTSQVNHRILGRRRDLLASLGALTGLSKEALAAAGGLDLSETTTTIEHLWLI